MHKLKLIILFLCAMCALTPQAAPVQKIDWNDKKLHWMSYETGMARLKASGKPGILIIYADWCPTCKTYSKLFNNPDVVKALQGLVLIRANEDEERAVSRKYNLDGEYVPRTFALSANGEIIQTVYEKKDKYGYFISADKPDYLISFANSVKDAQK